MTNTKPENDTVTRYGLVAHWPDGRREELGNLYENETAATDEAGYWRRVLRADVRVGQVEIPAPTAAPIENTRDLFTVGGK